MTCLALGLLAWSVWIGWRLSTLHLHLVPLMALFVEIVGALSGIVIAVALLRAEQPREVFGQDRGDMDRFPLAVADVIGRTRATDLRRDLAPAARTVLKGRPPRSADVAMAAMLVDGPRRLLAVVAITLALLVGVTPLPMPSPPMLVVAAVAIVAIATSHVLLGEGKVRFGDRLRWSYAAVGEVLVRDDLEGVAPRKWVGTVATVVVVNLAVALRGMSDRWTHGFEPMTADDRAVTMTMAFFLVAGALYTLRMSTTPQQDNVDIVSRRLEERTARQSALGGAVCIGLIGLLAGILPGSVDAADDDPGRVEQIPETQAGDVGPRTARH